VDMVVPFILSCTFHVARGCQLQTRCFDDAPQRRWIGSPRPLVLLRATCNLQPATCNLQPATCNLQPATCNLQPATCNLQLSDSSTAACASPQRRPHPPSGPRCPRV